MAINTGAPPFVNTPLAALHAFLLKDFLHEIGQPLSLLGMMTHGFAGASAEAEDAEDLILSVGQSVRMAGALEQATQVYNLFRSVGLPSRLATLPHEQWDVAAARITVLTRLALARSGAALSIAPADCPVALNPLLAELETIAIALIKENAEHLGTNSGGRFDLDVQHQAGNEPDPSALQLSLTLNGNAHGDALAITAMAQWLAAAHGWVLQAGTATSRIVIARP